MPFKIVRNDITKMKVDAIVNTANENPVFSYGIDKAVYEAAGVPLLLAARKEIGYIAEGNAAVTSAFCLPADYIIHAVSPLFIDGYHGEYHKLWSCYANSLHLALEYGCRSIAFPLISTGSYGFPKDKAMEIALDAIQKFLMSEEIMVYLVVFDEESTKISGRLFDEIENYVDSQYVEQKLSFEYSNKKLSLMKLDDDLDEEDFDECEDYDDYDVDEDYETCSKSQVKSSSSPFSIESLWNRVKLSQKETFQKRLFRLIDEKKQNEVTVYKKAGKTKQFFHKIRCNENYQPSKHTVFAFSLALELSLDETKDLLASAGYAISPGNKFDIIMQYLIEHKVYDIYKVDCILYDFGIEYFFGCER